MDLIVNKGVGISEVAALIAYLLPSFLVLTIPMSVLLAILIALGRFSADSEVVAMKASGISLFQMIPPFMVFCFIGFLFTNVLTLSLLPRGNAALKQQLVAFAKKNTTAGMEAGVFKDTFKDVVFYFNDYDRKKNLIKGIFISDKRDSKRPSEISGEKAKLFFIEDNSKILLRIFNGSLHSLNKTSGDYQYLLFKSYELEVNLDLPQKKRRIKYREMGLFDLVRALKEKKASPKIGIEIQQRLAFPFACLVFGILGLPLGVYWRRGGKAYGFVLSILIVFSYYILLSFGENLAKNGYVSAFVGIWLPNVVFGVFGIFLFRKTAREEQFFMQKELQNMMIDLLDWTKEKFKKKRKKLKEPEPLISTGYVKAVQKELFKDEIVKTEKKQVKQNIQKEETVYLGNLISESFHKPGCRHYHNKNCTESFTNREDALKAGFKPCRKCKP